MYFFKHFYCLRSQCVFCTVWFSDLRRNLSLYRYISTSSFDSVTKKMYNFDCNCKSTNQYNSCLQCWFTILKIHSHYYKYRIITMFTMCSNIMSPVERLLCHPDRYFFFLGITPREACIIMNTDI